MNKFLFLILIIILSLSCDSKEVNYKVFHYNHVNACNSLDPAFARSQTNIWPVHHLYNTLVSLDDKLKITPSIASKWEISDSGKLYRFTIRDDVYFHDDPCFKEKSNLLSVKDVKYSLERLLDEKLNSPGAWILKDRIAKSGIEIVNDSVINIKLKTPFGPFLSLLSNKYCSIVSETAIKFYGPNYRKHPVGTGPFKFKKWIENRALYLVKNEKYFGKPVAYDGVKTSYINDKKIAFLELLNENLDFVSGLESAFIDELLTDDGELKIDKKGQIQFFKAPYLNTEYIGINQELVKNTIMGNLDFRKALNLSIDRNEMLGLLRNNVGSSAVNGFIPKGLPSFAVEQIGYPFDLDRAKDHLQKSGYLDKGSPEIQIGTNNDYLDIITYVARQWELIGINVKIDLYESALLRSEMRNGNIAAFRASWIADYPDAENFLSLFYSKNGAPPNYTRFENPRFDSLYEASVIELDFEKRVSMNKEMNQIIIDNCPVVFLFYDETALFYSSRVGNISVNSINQLNISQLSID